MDLASGLSGVLSEWRAGGSQLLAARGERLLASPTMLRGPTKRPHPIVQTGEVNEIADAAVARRTTAKKVHSRTGPHGVPVAFPSVDYSTLCCDGGVSKSCRGTPKAPAKAASVVTLRFARPRSTSPR